MNNPNRRLRLLLITVLISSGFLVTGEEPHALGPTGLAGMLSPTSVTITKVAQGSPAEGKLRVGDVLVGAGGVSFKKDLRKELADAIDQAEREQGKGLLALTLKDGRTVDVQLKVLGSYSATAPYNCPKSDAIITRAADHLVSSGKAASGCLCPGLLGLMATGEQKYIDVVKRELPKQPWFTPPTMDTLKALVKGDQDMGYVGWYWGYYCIILGEYYQLTQDASALPALKAYATGLAMGQDAGGLWGHRMATEKRKGRLPGYAQINQPSMTCFMGMLMAQKCGIQEPVLTQAIEKTHAFYATFIGKGAFNYGVHGPNTGTFNNNGTSASGALAMSLKGDTQGAAFFSRLSATSYDGLETGHASYWFNVLWTPLGANLCGPEVTTQFFEKSRWLQTMYRAWDGSFTFDGEDPKMGDHSGAALLAYCLPRRKLVITGKNADESLWLKGKAATELIALSQLNYSDTSEDELIALFGHPLPQVTRKAVWALRAKKGDFIPKLVKLLKSGTKREKQSALGYFGYGCPKEVALARLADLGAILRDPAEDPEVRAAAASALSCLGEPAYPYYFDLVKLVAEERPADRFGDIDWSLGTSINALCATPFKAGLVTDKKIFYTAATKLAENKRQHVRADGLRMLAGMPLEDFYLVADTVMHVVKNDDPTYHSYHSPGGPVGAGVALLANLHIEDGMQYTMDVLDDEDGKWGFKARMVMEALTKYGPAAKPLLEKLRADPRFKGMDQGRTSGPWKAMVQAIESPAETSQKMISFEAAKQVGLKTQKEIKSYCLDFNWAATTRKRAPKPFAAPGTWAGAEPAQHVAWYKAMGANVIQTFAISCNGYAWYKNGFVPEQPGLKYDFLPDVVKLGHKEGLLVFGYFCIASNPKWGTDHPDLSYGTPTTYHIPYTDEYLAYLSAAIGDAVRKTGMDGFMIDWVWMPNRSSTEGKWLDSEKKLYTQLMGEPFPGEAQLAETSPQYLAYSRKALDRCWKTIRKAAKDANPNCIIWLTSNQIKHPHVINSDMYKEADWLMNESGDKRSIDAVKAMIGPHTRLITCLARWNGQDATQVVPEALAAGIGLYGFTVPRNDGGLVPLEEILSRPVSELKGDDRNIAVLSRAFHGASIESVKNDKGEFVEPKK